MAKANCCRFFSMQKLYDKLNIRIDKTCQDLYGVGFSSLLDKVEDEKNQLKEPGKDKTRMLILKSMVS